jgi:hypothetical protein
MRLAVEGFFRKGIVSVYLQNVWSCENAEFGRTYNS